MMKPLHRVIIRWRAAALLLLLLAEGALALYEDDPYVVTFTDDSDYNEQVVESDPIWFLQLYDPASKESKKFAPMYAKIAEVMRGMIKVAAVDATADGFGTKLASKLGDGSKYPALFLIGRDKRKPAKYSGPRELNNMVQAAFDEMGRTAETRAGGRGGGGGSGGDQGQQQQKTGGASKVVHLDKSNFAEKIYNDPRVSLVAFIAPWCGHCKALLPEWDMASVQLDGEGVFLGVVDATVETELAGMFGVNGFPTIKVFPGGTNKSSPNDAIDYTGGRTAQQIVREALAEVDRSGVPKEIPELTSQQTFDENCNGKNKICVMAALPHILDSAASGRNKYRDMLTNISKSFRGSAYSFLWFEGGSQPELEQATELTFGFPALVALSVDKEVYAVLHGSFSEQAISKFLFAITAGRQATVKLGSQGVPKINTVEPWDGQDGAPPEEELSLAEIMGWDEEDGQDDSSKEL